VSAVTAYPLPLRKAVEHILTQPSEDGGLSQARCRCDTLDEIGVVATVLDHPRCMQQLVYESVAEQQLVSSKNRVEADSDSTRRDPQPTSSEQLVGVKFESGHTKTTLLLWEPLDSQVLAKVTQKRRIVLSK
jgi:hypothetical protein